MDTEATPKGLRRFSPARPGQWISRGGFWGRKLALFSDVTIHDVFDKFEKVGALDNFDRVARGETGTHCGPPFFDGLVYETIRGAADFLAFKREPRLEDRVDGYVRRIAAAQDAVGDGYLNTHVTLLLPSQRWGSNGGDQLWHHEVYNAGCLAEAGVHYFQATGETSLLAVAVRFANLLVDLTLGKDRRAIIPTHALPEEAFLKLYRLLSDEPALATQVATRPATEHLHLVRYWLDQRGRHQGRISFTEYAQDHVPLVDQAEAVGHSVRALLCYTGLTAFCRETAEPAYEETARRLWADVTGRKMHISGGVGPIREIEGFSHGFHLPNDGYLETCAGIALAFWAHQMGLHFGAGEHADIVERVLYNIALGGVGLTGTSYAYRNPLHGDGELRRWEWHECPCCPPMLMKLMASLPGMAFSIGDGRLTVNHYLAGEAVVSVDGHEVRLLQETDYPWDGRIAIQVNTSDRHEFELCCRIPGWCEKWSASIDGEPIDRPMVGSGHLCIRREWNGDETVELDLTMDPTRMQANPSVHDDRGRVAVQRGPILYCFEAVDNAGLPELTIGVHPEFTERHDAGLLGDVVVVEASAGDGSRLTAVPFYARGNRADGPDEFEVWVRQEGAVPDNRDGAPAWLYRPYEPSLQMLTTQIAPQRLTR